MSVAGEDYRTSGPRGGADVRARLAALDQELPDQLQAWLEQLRKQLSKEWYKELKHTEAIMWDQWLKDFQDVSKLSPRDAVLLQPGNSL